MQSYRITKLLSIKHIFTSPYRPRLNGATERVHRWLNAAIGIFCEQHQSDWESYLQPATYSHNTSPIQGTKDLDPFFLNFGRHALPPEVISLQLPPRPTSSDTYAEHLVQRLATARKQFQALSLIFVDLNASIMIPSPVQLQYHPENKFTCGNILLFKKVLQPDLFVTSTVHLLLLDHTISVVTYSNLEP